MKPLAPWICGGSYGNVCCIEKRASTGVSRLDPKNCKCLWETEDKVSRCIRDVSESKQPNDSDDQIPECGHDLRSVASAYPRTILIKAHIAYIVHSVFDFPMSPI